MSSLYFTGIAPSATASLSNTQNAFITSGASSFIFLILVRFSLLYIRLVACVDFGGRAELLPGLDAPQRVPTDWLSSSASRPLPDIRRRLRSCREFWRCCSQFAVQRGRAGAQPAHLHR